jgi:hypothetical protein
MGANLGVVHAFVIGLAFLQVATDAGTTGGRLGVPARSWAPAARTDMRAGEPAAARSVAALSPCAAFGAALGVLIGEAGVPVGAPVRFADGLGTTLKLPPVTVERVSRRRWHDDVHHVSRHRYLPDAGVALPVVRARLWLSHHWDGVRRVRNETRPRCRA